MLYEMALKMNLLLYPLSNRAILQFSLNPSIVAAIITAMKCFCRYKILHFVERKLQKGSYCFTSKPSEFKAIRVQLSSGRCRQLSREYQKSEGCSVAPLSSEGAVQLSKDADSSIRVQCTVAQKVQCSLVRMQRSPITVQSTVAQKVQSSSVRMQRSLLRMRHS